MWRRCQQTAQGPNHLVVAAAAAAAAAPGRCCCCGGGLFPWCCRYAAALSTDSAGPQSPGCCDGGCCCGGGCRGDCVERGEEVPVSPLPGNAAALSTDNAGPQSRLKVQYDATVRCAKAERYADVHSVEDLIREIWDDQRLLLFAPIRDLKKPVVLFLLLLIYQG